MTESLHALSIDEIGLRLRSRKLSVSELVTYFLERIDRYDGAIRAFSRVTADRAMRQAKVAQDELDRGIYRGPLHGIPVALKDNIDVAGQLTGCNSRAAKRSVPEVNASVVNRLRKAGAIELGKTTLHEFAFGGPAWDTPDEPARNPWDTSRFTGGSSSGSAAAVAAGLAPIAVGTDTVGSIRLPAAKCGVVGFKPTFGRIPTRGTVPLAYSLDHAGPMAGRVKDCRHLFSAMLDPGDGAPSTEGSPAPSALKGLRVGYARHFYESDVKVESDVQRVMDASTSLWANLGAHVIDIELTNLDVYAACCMTIMLSEALALHEEALRTRPTAFGEIVRDRLALALFFTSADYVQAKRLKQVLTKEMMAAFSQVDVLVTAAFPSEAPPLTNVDKYYILQTPLMTTPFNVTGAPTVCLPVGFSDNGLPLGIQIAAAPANDKTLLAVAEAFEKQTGFPEERIRRGLPLGLEALSGAGKPEPQQV